jgi:hypothetical protein
MFKSRQVAAGRRSGPGDDAGDQRQHSAGDVDPEEVFIGFGLPLFGAQLFVRVAGAASRIVAATGATALVLSSAQGQ